MPNESEAMLAIWEALRPKFIALIKETTKDCLRIRRAQVAVAASGGVIGVKFPFDDTTHYLKYASIAAGLTVGAEVVIGIPYSDGTDLSNARVIQNGSWTL